MLRSIRILQLAIAKAPVVLLVVALVSLSACGGDGFLFNPAITVTPATAPVIEQGGGGEVSPATAVNTPVDATPTATPESEPTVTLAPTRTPYTIKAPAPLPTATPGPTDVPTIAPTPTPTLTIETATSTATLAPAAAPEEMASPTAPITSTLTPHAPDQGIALAADAAVEQPERRIDGTMNILVVGSDERTAGEPWRSDVIMIAAVDFAAREVGVISFPRDLWVRIPTVGENRINTATVYGELNRYKDGGGIGLLRDTIGQNFGIRIDHYVKFSFTSFEDVVDALGGVDIEVDCPITGNFPREIGSKIRIWRTLPPGNYHMDGYFALAYARERKTTSDVDRTRRQQRLLIAMREQARNVNIIPRIPALYDALKGTIETDLGLTDIIALGRLAVLIEPARAHGFVIGYREVDSWTTPEGAAVLLPNMNAINTRLVALFDQPSILENPNKPANCTAQ